MNNRVRHPLLLIAALAVLSLAPTALASPADVVRDCAEDGSLDGSYSEAEKRAALGEIPADLDEYSDCRAIIGADGKLTARASSIASSGTAGATGPAARKAAAQRTEKARARARQVRERALGARSVDPRDASVFKAANTANGMPLPMTLALVALALLALTAALVALQRRNPAFADALRRVTPRRFRR